MVDASTKTGSCEWMPPPRPFTTLLLIVELTIDRSIALSSLKTPPPLAAVLWLTVTRSSVAVPLFRIAPPSPELVFPDRTTSVRLTVPLLKIAAPDEETLSAIITRSAIRLPAPLTRTAPPPLPVLRALTRLTSLSVSSAPATTSKIRLSLIASMMVVFASTPTIVTSFKMSKSPRFPASSLPVMETWYVVFACSSIVSPPLPALTCKMASRSEVTPSLASTTSKPVVT